MKIYFIKCLEKVDIIPIFPIYIFEAIYRIFIDSLLRNRTAKVGNGGLSRMILFLQTGGTYRRLVGRC